MAENALDAVREAALLRFLPIMMTTMAAQFGGVPLVLGSGTGSDIRQPLGPPMRLHDGAVRPILTMMRIWTLTTRSSRRPNDLTFRGKRHYRR